MWAREKVVALLRAAMADAVFYGLAGDVWINRLLCSAASLPSMKPPTSSHNHFETIFYMLLTVQQTSGLCCQPLRTVAVLRTTW